MFWKVRKALESRAASRPLVLLIEDVHWAEPTLLELLEHLVEWTRKAPILLLCTARPEFVDAGRGWAGQPKMAVLLLDPLDAADTDRLIDVLLGESSATELRDRIRNAAAGNPLFVEQLAAATLEGDTGQDVPVTIQALLAARLETLSTEERDVLERASVVGLEFAWEELARLADDGSRPPGSVLAALIRKQLISRHELVDDMFAFDHMLIRDAAYERLSKTRRADLHERLARWIDTHGDEFAEIVGYHFEQAYQCLADLGRHSERAEELAREAAERLSASGMRAFALGDSTAAANLLRRSTRLLSHDPLRAAELEVALGQALRDAGRMDEAVQVLTEAVGLADGAHLRAAAADARIVLAEIQLHRYIETGVTREDVLRDLAAGIAVFEESSDDARLGRALCIAGKLHFWKGEVSDSVVDFERSARHAQRAGDTAQEALSLQSLAAAMFYGPTPAEAALVRMAEIRGRMSTNHSLVAAVACLAGELECERGRFDVGRPLLDEASAITEEHGLALLRIVSAERGKGRIALLAGDGAAAERILRAACQAADAMGERGYLSSLAPELVEALVASGRLADALEVSDRWRPETLTVPEDADAYISWNRSRALALVRAGHVDDAERHIGTAVSMVLATDYLAVYADTQRVLAEVLRAAGRDADAAEAAREAASAYARKGYTVMAERMNSVLLR
jgi:tetratricopeptide (TPR) repeat protein